MRSVSAVRAVLILIGFTAAIAQIVVLRELMVVFYGNEISIGLTLASWLLWAAAGSATFGAATKRRGLTARVSMAALETVAAVTLPLTVLAVRASKGMLQTVPGESLGPGTMLLASLVVLGPFCLVSGGLFAAGSRMWEQDLAATRAQSTGTMYLLETAGSAAGGLLAGILLLRHLNSLEIAFLLALLNLLAAVALFFERPAVRAAAAAGLLAMFAFWLFPFAVPHLESLSMARFWRGFQVIAIHNSNYGNLAVLGTEGSRSVYEKGAVLFNAPDPAAAEETVHYALLEHPAPWSLLMIGGGVNGSLAEALKHPGIERIDYVELDPAVLELAAKYFHPEPDPRIHSHVTDGRLFLKTDGPAFDVIIVNAPDPQTAQLNRFYTVEFFREAAARLAPGGILSFRLSASENYISPELGDFLRSIHKTLRAVFPEVVAIPGDAVHFFAARQPGVLVSRPADLLARLRARRIATTYVSETFIPFRMARDRVIDLEEQIRPLAETPVNRDFAPIAYYFNVALWSGRFQHGYRGLFRWLSAVRFWLLAAAVGGILLFMSVGVGRLTGPGARSRAAAAFCTASTGFTMIGLELLLLLAFQATHGYVYQQLAVVIAAFMAGMALGSWLTLRRPAHGLRTLAWLQMLTALSPLLLYAVFVTAPHPFVYPGLAVLCGLLGGCQFPVASSIYFAAGTGGGPGPLYAIDLAGSCVAAVLFAGWLVPVFGFLNTALLTALIGAAPALTTVWICRTPAR